MKKIILILVILFTARATFLKAQIADTAIYIQQILLNKNKYIGKPFSFLENYLKIKIKYFCSLSFTSDINKERATFMGFIYPITDENEDFPGLMILLAASLFKPQ